MNKIRSFFQQSSEPAYESLNDGPDTYSDDGDSAAQSDLGDDDESRFSWIEYGIFVLLGIAMLWAWNMFLAAAPYFHSRFETHEWILNYFQPAQVSASTVVNLVTVTILTSLQKDASYPRRIIVALVTSSTSFTLLALSTLTEASAATYFGFMLIMVVTSTLGTAFLQNGVFAYVAGFGEKRYTQGIMTGQAIAGVLPPLVQIFSVLAVRGQKDPEDGGQGSGQSPKAAAIYFAAAVAVSATTLLAFIYLIRSNKHRDSTGSATKAIADEDAENEALNRRPDRASKPTVQTKDSIPLTTLFMKLPFLSISIMLCFAVSMVFPVFTISIPSVSGIGSAIFIPLAFLLWNCGDLAGRLMTISPAVSLGHYPFALFCIAMSRLLFIPLYFLCNIKGRGAIVSSDFFYLVVVQFGFGLTNGDLGSQCMMGAGEWVAPVERAAAGSFMSLMLVSGLTVGSLLSFTLGDI